MRAAIYARVSTTDRGQDTANQLAELQRFASCQGWQVAEVYEDQVSGSKGRDRLSRQGPYETLDVVKEAERLRRPVSFSPTAVSRHDQWVR